MNPAGPGHHMMAMMATGGFAARLGKVTAPTVIIHGDADPLVHLKGGKHSAESISHATLEVVPGMGHEFPPSLYTRITDSIIENFPTPAATASSRVETSPSGEVPDVEVLIAGAGFSGLGVAIKLKEAGLSDFLILERANEVGGTWRDNTYPGCACDVQSHLYSYSFETKADWSRKYAGWKEIGQYLRNCAAKYDLYSHIKFGVEWKGAQYDEQAGLWRVQVSGGKLISARALVMAVGPLSNPAIPDIPGLDEFRGQRFHSATWEHDYDLSGKKVAVIGTGASAIQFVPEIAKKVSKLSLFQRTPAWVLSKEDRSFSPREIRRFQRSPTFHQAYRSRIYWRSEFLLRALVNPDSRFNRIAEKRGLDNLHKHVKDKALREALTPAYPIGCKRVLLSDNYYPSLVRDNVDLITTGIEKISADGIHDVLGGFHPVDAIIWGTGFTASDPLGGLSLQGRDGQCLREVWKSNDYQSYLGIVAHGFPNMFLMTGPNTGLGHTSIVVMIEAQANYIIQALKHLSRGVVRSLEVRTDVQETFSKEVQDKLQGTVWTSGCSSWYHLASGKNFAIWPDYTFRYKERCEQLNMSDYKVNSQPNSEHEDSV
ncbi:MAG: NAD(P)-binding domain-containing protein [Kofleriaceae bacterium]|nr:NAD(P)-binding domain-containing protein [Kofleriaceae bacterium]